MAENTLPQQVRHNGIIYNLQSDGKTYLPEQQAAPQNLPQQVKHDNTVYNLQPDGNYVPETSFLGTMKEAAIKGLGEATEETAAITSPYALPKEKIEPTTETEKILQQDISEGWKDPKWWAARAAYGATKSYPTIGGGLVGAAAGTPAGPWGTVIGGAGGAAIGSMAQTLAPAYRQAREEGLDHEAAVDRAWNDMYASGAFGAVSGALPLFRLAKGPISNILAQIFVAQPAIGAGQRTTTKLLHEGELPSAEELGKGYAEDVGMGTVMTLPHAAVKTASTLKGAALEAPGAIKKFVKAEQPPPIPTPEQIAAQEMGLKLFGAEKTGAKKDIDFLVKARAGAFGDEAKRIADEAFDTRFQQIQNKAQQIGAELSASGADYPTMQDAAQKIESELLNTASAYRTQIENLVSLISESTRGEGPLFTDKTQLGEDIKTVVRQQAEAQRQEYKNLYETAKQTKGGFNTSSFYKLGSDLKNNLPDLNISSETPITNKAINYLDKLENFLKPDDQSIIDFQGIEQARIGLNDIYREAAASKTGSELFNVQKIINAFDKHIDDTVANSLFTGDKQGLQAYKDARASYHKYMKTYSKQPGDPVSRNLSRIVEHDPTPEQVAKYIVNTNDLGATEGSVGTVKKLKNILGEDSDIISGIKQFVWKEIADTKNDKKMQQFSNSSLAKELYSDDVLAAMRTHANAVSSAKKLFENRDIGGKLGKIFDRIVEGTSDTPEVERAIFSSIGTTNEAEVSRFVNAVKNVTGPDSPSIDAIRNGIYKKLTSGTPEEVSSNLLSFVDQKQSKLASSIFTPQELNKLKTYAQAIKPTLTTEGVKAAPVKKPVPPSIASVAGKALAEEGVSRAAGAVIPGGGFVARLIMRAPKGKKPEMSEKQALKKLREQGVADEILKKSKNVVDGKTWKALNIARSLSQPERIKEEEEPTKSYGGSVTDKMHMANGGKIRRRRKLWTDTDKTWNNLDQYEKAAVMSLMEADADKKGNIRIDDAHNILGAIANRAARDKQDLGTHVSQAIYQPTFEKNQQARLKDLIKHPALPELKNWIERRSQGLEPDIVNGATHYLAPESRMLYLESLEPNKYKSWRKWTNFDPKTLSYKGVILRDRSHAFLAPEGKYSAPYQVAGEIPPILRTVTPEQRDSAKLTQMAEAAAEPVRPQPADQAAMNNLVKETATISKPELNDLEDAKFLQAIQGFMKGQQQLPPAPAPLAVPQAPRVDVPIVIPYGRAKGGSVTEKMLWRKKHSKKH